MANQVTVHVFMTPLAAINAYGTEIEISEYIFEESIGEIREFIDSEDYDFGLFAFGDIEIAMENSGGWFNTPDDYRSLFPLERDLAKIRVVYRETTITRDDSGNVTDSSYTDTTIFNGIINDEATRQDIVMDTITFRVLSQDSIIDTAKVVKGLISDGDSVQQAILKVFDDDRIKSVFTATPANVQPDQDVLIDDASQFDNLNAGQVIRDLLLVSNSILYLDSSNNVIVKSREENTTAAILYLYGRYDEHGRENVVNIQNYNNGYHRLFNSIRAGENEIGDSDSVDEFGLKQKEISMPFITTGATITQIITALLDEFVTPKIELEVQVPMETAKDTVLLQRASINYPYNLLPDGFFPIVGDAVYNDTETKYPELSGSVEIHPNIKFKIIEKRYDLANMMMTLKVRQTGTTFGTGYYA